MDGKHIPLSKLSPSNANADLQVISSQLVVITCCGAGTLDYLAPEMLRNPSTGLEEGRASTDDIEREGLAPYGTSVDVWAVGIIAYELVTGAAPFTQKGEPELDTMNRILQRYDIDFPGSMSPQWAHFVR